MKEKYFYSVMQGDSSEFVEYHYWSYDLFNEKEFEAIVVDALSQITEISCGYVGSFIYLSRRFGEELEKWNIHTLIPSQSIDIGDGAVDKAIHQAEVRQKDNNE